MCGFMLLSIIELKSYVFIHCMVKSQHLKYNNINMSNDVADVGSK